MAYENVPDGVPEERIVEGHDRPARITEDDLDAFGNQRVEQYRRTVHLREPGT
jgi:hypothetical protein